MGPGHLAPLGNFIKKSYNANYYYILRASNVVSLVTDFQEDVEYYSNKT